MRQTGRPCPCHRCHDSFVTFEEILKKAAELEVDFLLLGGDRDNPFLAFFPVFFGFFNLTFSMVKLFLSLHGSCGGVFCVLADYCQRTLGSTGKPFCKTLEKMD